jgi:hypothetical protein
MRTTNILAERNSQLLVTRDVSNKMRESGLEKLGAPLAGEKLFWWAFTEEYNCLCPSGAECSCAKLNKIQL